MAYFDVDEGPNQWNITELSTNKTFNEFDSTFKQIFRIRIGNIQTDMV